MKEKPLRIMPLGDSIVRGKGGSTWRLHLQELLKQAGISSVYVGSCPHAPNLCAEWGDPYLALKQALVDNIEHEGWGGLKIHELAELKTHDFYPDFTIHELIKKNPADIILLMIGTNDLKDRFHIETASGRLASLAQKILSASTGILMVSSLLPIFIENEPGMEKDVRRFNREVKKEVDACRQAGKRIHYVQMYPDFSREDFLPDGIHPNFTGDKKIAMIWFQNIMRLLP